MTGYLGESIRFGTNHLWMLLHFYIICFYVQLLQWGKFKKLEYALLYFYKDFLCPFVEGSCNNKTLELELEYNY